MRDGLITDSVLKRKLYYEIDSVIDECLDVIKDKHPQGLYSKDFWGHAGNVCIKRADDDYNLVGDFYTLTGVRLAGSGQLKGIKFLECSRIIDVPSYKTAEKFFNIYKIYDSLSLSLDNLSFFDDTFKDFLEECSVGGWCIGLHDVDISPITKLFLRDNLSQLFLKDTGASGEVCKVTLSKVSGVSIVKTSIDYTTVRTKKLSNMTHEWKPALSKRVLVDALDCLISICTRLDSFGVPVHEIAVVKQLFENDKKGTNCVWNTKNVKYKENNCVIII